MKNWIKKAIARLKDSLEPVPQELNELDWKESLSARNNKLSQHLSAFANHPGGGYLTFGIDDKTGRIKGITKTDASPIIEKLASLGRDTLDPLVKIDHAIVDYQSKPLLLIQIAESSIKPVHLKSGTIEDCFIRSGGTTRKASRQEIGSLMLNSKILRWEELHASKLLSSRDVSDKLDFRKIHQLLNRPVPENTAEIFDWMDAEKMVKIVNGSGFYITNFGAISAARSLKDFDDLSRKSIRVIKYKGNNKKDTEREIHGNKGYAIGFEGLIGVLNTILPKSEIIREALREETSVYPELALRELIANALIHQDFSVRGKGPMIEIFDNRIEISNPGRLLPSKKIDRLIGTSPESRNEALAAAFRRYKICEERGTGFQKAIISIEIFGLPPLHFEEGENYFKVTILAPKTFAQMSTKERIDACYQHAVIKHLSGETMTNTTLRERLKLHDKLRSMVSRLIKEALSKNIIKPKDPDNKSVKFNEYIPYWA